jgi:hypothetical protein
MPPDLARRGAEVCRLGRVMPWPIMLRATSASYICGSARL